MQNGKNQKDIHRRIQGKSGIGNHQRQQALAEPCREYNLKADLLSHWKMQFLDNAAKVFETATETDPQQARIAEMERLAGKQSLEMEIQKKR